MQLCQFLGLEHNIKSVNKFYAIILIEKKLRVTIHALYRLD